jgi:hypothetical protein
LDTVQLNGDVKLKAGRLKCSLDIHLDYCLLEHLIRLE